ncbi:sugar ABC transporter permease [Nostocaceae cyanobacterium CENA357]|uniref:Sugar ABC transporter permease n=1 Tax=Atlanticothrix silvestris CENA357 TaxID=1725252 RepID=A0A8J7HJ26_9CYAN|nr:sugar ABC transporter permease [Atlanticothrix silvestris]MBH8555991.1 sugar ABC transporter permease [Atlanticothrix silvestris CENA357]
MVTQSNAQVTISLTELGLDDEDLQTTVQNLLPQLREVDGVEDADLVAVENAPKNTKALGGFVLGLLNAQVNAANIKTLFKFLGDRLGNKPIKMVLKAPDGRELNLEASSREEFEFAFQKAQDFLNNTANSKDE